MGVHFHINPKLGWIEVACADSISIHGFFSRYPEDVLCVDCKRTTVFKRSLFLDYTRDIYDSRYINKLWRKQ